MKLGRLAAIVFAVLTVGLVAGGAMAMVVITPPPTPPPRIPSVTYTVFSPTPQVTAMFQPFVAASYPGLVLIHLINHDLNRQVYLLTGLGIAINAPPGVSVMMLALLSHPGEYAWVTTLPTPGSPAGVTVGILIVE